MSCHVMPGHGPMALASQVATPSDPPAAIEPRIHAVSMWRHFCSARYLAVVLDLFSRKVVGWGISESLVTPVFSSDLRQAVESRGPKAGELLHHSDRGCQYTSDDYQWTLLTLGGTCSMSRTGCC